MFPFDHVSTLIIDGLFHPKSCLTCPEDARNFKTLPHHCRNLKSEIDARCLV